MKMIAFLCVLLSLSALGFQNRVAPTPATTSGKTTGRPGHAKRKLTD
jgi:hypothetical protein